MSTGPRRHRGESAARVIRPSDLTLFLGATFGFSWLMWAMALLAGRQVSALGGPLAVVAFALFTGPLSEEFGWRGYAQPRLRRTLSPWATSVVLGLAWGLWHLPLFLLVGTSQSELGLFSWRALLFFVGWVPVSYTIWTVSERLRGGVAAAVVTHAAVNAADGLFPAPSTAGPLIGTAAATGIAIALSALNGRTHRRDATGVSWSAVLGR